MRVKAAYVREKIELQEVSVEHVNTENQLADMLTKPMTAKKFTSNRSWLMTMLQILMCLTVMTSVEVLGLFERVDPLVWSSTNKYVDHGLSFYNVELRFANPCSLLNKLPRPVERSQITAEENAELQALMLAQQQRSITQPEVDRLQLLQQRHQGIQQQAQADADYNFALKEALDHCNQVYSESILTPLHELRVSSTLNRPKRFIQGFVTGMFFSNLIMTWKDKIFPGKAETELQERQRVVEERLEKMNNDMNMTEIAEKAMGASFQAMAEILKHDHNRLSSFINRFPILVFTTNYFVMHIIMKGTTLARMKYGTKQRRLDLPSMSDLTNSDWLSGLEEHSAIIRSMGSPSPSVLRVEFQARERDPTTDVFRVDPFRYWANLTEALVLMEYVGERFLIYNKSSNCIRAIDEPSQQYVTAMCDTPNGIDKRLALWQRVLQVEDPYDQPANTTLKESWPYTYVYCFRLNITTKAKTSRCPPYVFRLNASMPWNTTDLRYEPQKFDFDRTAEIFPATHDVHSVHFLGEEHLVDENSAIDKILDLRELVSALNQQNVAIQLPVKGGNVSYATAFYSSMWLTIILFGVVIGVVVYKHTKQEELLIRTANDTKHTNLTLREVLNKSGQGQIYEEIKRDIISKNSGPRESVANTNTIASPTQLNVNISGGPSVSTGPEIPKPRAGYRYTDETKC